jgi:hypothetical protein
MQLSVQKLFKNMMMGIHAVMSTNMLTVFFRHSDVVVE